VLTELTFGATIDQMDRFGQLRDIGAHVGLTPGCNQSGETGLQGRIRRISRTWRELPNDAVRGNDATLGAVGSALRLSVAG